MSSDKKIENCEIDKKRLHCKKHICSAKCLDISRKKWQLVECKKSYVYVYKKTKKYVCLYVQSMNQQSDNLACETRRGVYNFGRFWISYICILALCILHHAHYTEQGAHVAKCTCCKVQLLQIARVAKCMCSNVHVLQKAHVVKCKNKMSSNPHSDMKKIPFGSGGTILIIWLVPQLSHTNLYDFKVAWQDFQLRGDKVVKLGTLTVLRRPHSSRLQGSITIFLSFKVVRWLHNC